MSGGFNGSGRAQAYRQMRATSASPGQLLVMLYDGAIRFVEQGKLAIAQGDVRRKGEQLGRALAIIQELVSTLDDRHSPELAQNLRSLYLFLVDQLTRANLASDPQLLDGVLTVLRTLRDGWVEASRTVARGASPDHERGTQA